MRWEVEEGEACRPILRDPLQLVGLSYVIHQSIVMRADSIHKTVMDDSMQGSLLVSTSGLAFDAAWLLLLAALLAVKPEGIAAIGDPLETCPAVVKDIDLEGDVKIEDRVTRVAASNLRSTCSSAKVRRLCRCRPVRNIAKPRRPRGGQLGCCRCRISR